MMSASPTCAAGCAIWKENRSAGGAGSAAVEAQLPFTTTTHMCVPATMAGRIPFTRSIDEHDRSHGRCGGRERSLVRHPPRRAAKSPPRWRMEDGQPSPLSIPTCAPSGTSTIHRAMGTVRLRHARQVRPGRRSRAKTPRRTRAQRTTRKRFKQRPTRGSARLTRRRARPLIRQWRARPSRLRNFGPPSTRPVGEACRPTCRRMSRSGKRVCTRRSRAPASSSAPCSSRSMPTPRSSTDRGAQGVLCTARHRSGPGHRGPARRAMPARPGPGCRADPDCAALRHRSGSLFPGAQEGSEGVAGGAARSRDLTSCRRCALADRPGPHPAGRARRATQGRA
jgi:hypothetical protein